LCNRLFPHRMDYNISDGNNPTTMSQAVIKTKIIQQFSYTPRSNYEF